MPKNLYKLIELLLSEIMPPSNQSPTSAYDKCYYFVKTEFSLMPLFYRIPIYILIQLFFFYCFIVSGCSSFNSLTQAKQKKLVTRWEKLWHPGYILFRLIRNLVYLCYFSQSATEIKKARSEDSFQASYCLTMPSMLSCDVLVIGAGVGGTTLAHELISAGIDTLLIDEGPFIKDIYQRPAFQNFSDVWRCGGLTAAFGKPPIAYAEGSCVGGGSEINSGIFQSAPAELLNELAKKYSIEEFNSVTLQAYYEKAEAMVNAQYLEPKLDSLTLEQAAHQLNWKGTYLKVAQKNKVKQSMCETLLPAALDKGLRLIAQCKAKKLILKNGQVTEVRAIATDHTGQKHTFRIKAKSVFVCSGAIYTPYLLLKSGIKKNIGRSLQMHPTLKTLCHFKNPVSQEASSVPSYAITEFMPEIRIGGSVMSPTFIAMSIAEDWKNRHELLNKMNYCGVYYAMIKPESMGKIRYIPGCKDPLVTYKLSGTDWAQLFKGLDYLQQTMFAAGATQVIPSVENHKGWYEKTSLDTIKTLKQNTFNLMSIHLFASCPMGEDKAQCAVNSFGKLHDYQNLYINDASIIPEALGTNPQGTIMALALRNAEHFIKTRSSE